MEMIHAVESKPVVVKGVIQQVNSASEHLTGCSLGPGFMEMIHAVESKPVVVKGVIQQVNECKRLVSTVITSELARQPQHNLPQRSDRHWRIRPLVGTNQHEDDPCCAAAPEQTKEGKTR